jgi:hypothetical protein
VDKETDSPNGFSLNRTMDTRAAAAQALYDAGICFFPLRGNHEWSALAAAEMPILFPQTTGGGMTCGASNFSSPDPYGNGNLTGLTYKFDIENARFVFLDQFTEHDIVMADTMIASLAFPSFISCSPFVINPSS